MKEEIKKNNKNRWLNIRLSEVEYQKMMKGFSNTADQKLSNYARKLLLAKPVKVLYRNATLDDFMDEMILLRRELSAIGNNFNQLVKRINSVKESPEIYLLSKYSRQMQAEILQVSTQIKLKIEKITDQWYQN